MPQYRVELHITRTELVDIMADDEGGAKLAAVAAFGGTDGSTVEAVSAKLIAGQAEPEYVPEPPSVQGDEA